MKQPTSRNVRARVAPGGDERAVVAPAATAQEGAAERACVEALGRIAALHAELATMTLTLAQNLELELAVRAEPSVMLPVAPPANKAPPNPELLTSADMRALLKCKSRTLRRLELLKEIPTPMGQGRLKRWRKCDIDAWLAEGGRR